MAHAHPVVAIVGATGAVGQEILTLLAERRFPVGDLRLLASPKSAGMKVPFRGRDTTVAALGDRSFDGVDIALFSAGSSISKQYGPVAAEQGATVIDNSSAFRMDPRVPLVVPEVNAEALPKSTGPRGRAGGIIANPNCSTIILLVPLTPLRRAFGIDRVIVSTYQAASGAGAKGMHELVTQTRESLDGRPLTREVFHEPYAFNLFSHNTAIDPATGLNVEESKVIAETRKIWGDDSVRVSATCIRVATLRAHAESVNVTLKRAATTAQVREALASAPGVTVVDDRAANSFPTPLKASGKDNVLVGRIRPDPTQLPAGAGADAPTLGFDLFLCGDQLRKGAALNAIQIAEALLARE